MKAIHFLLQLISVQNQQSSNSRATVTMTSDVVPPTFTRSSTVDMQIQQIWSRLGCLVAIQHTAILNVTQTCFNEQLLRAAARLMATKHSGPV